MGSQENTHLGVHPVTIRRHLAILRKLSPTASPTVDKPRSGHPRIAMFGNETGLKSFLSRDLFKTARELKRMSLVGQTSRCASYRSLLFSEPVGRGGRGSETSWSQIPRILVFRNKFRILISPQIESKFKIVRGHPRTRSGKSRAIVPLRNILSSQVVQLI